MSATLWSQKIWRAGSRSYLLRRFTTSIVLLCITSVVTFVVLRLLPGDPTSIRASRPGVTTAQINAIREQLGLNRSMPRQYITWIADILHGNFGYSYFSGYPVTTLLRTSAGPTLELTLVSIIVGLVLAVGLAVMATVGSGGLADRLCSLFVAGALSVPPFVIGILLIIFFGRRLGWLPTRGYVSFAQSPLSNIRYLILPAVTMSVAVAAPITRMLRAALAEEVTADYVRTARATGRTWANVVLTDALRNAFVPTLALVGLTIGYLLGGVVVVEYVFSWPGIGTLAVQSVLTRDYAVLQGIVLFTACCFIGTSLAVDLITRWLDPRIRGASA